MASILSCWNPIPRVSPCSVHNCPINYQRRWNSPPRPEASECNDRAERKLGLEGEAQKWFTSFPSSWNNITRLFFGQPLFCREKLNCRERLGENIRGKLAKCWKVKFEQVLFLSHLSLLRVDERERFNRRRHIIPTQSPRPEYTFLQQSWKNEFCVFVLLPSLPLTSFLLWV